MIAVQRYELTEFLRSGFPSSEALVEGFLYKEQNTLLVATQKAGKTILTCQLALCVSHGVDFLRWPVPEARKVVYFCFEGSNASLQKRFRRQAAGLGLSELREDMLVLYRTPYLFLAQEVTLAEVDDVLTKEKPDLVIFDPLYRLLAGGSITKDEVVMPMTGALLALSMKHHHATWLPTHEHRTKYDSYGQQYETSAQRYAGSYVLAAWCEAMYGLSLEKDTKKARFTTHFERDEDEESGPRQPLDLKLHSTKETLAFELGLSERILMKLPALAGKSLRAAARELNANFESFRTAVQGLAKDSKLVLYSQGQGKETIIGFPDANEANRHQE